MQKRFKLCQRSNLKSILAPTLHQLFIIEKYVKIRSKIRKSPCYFLRSRGQKIKNTTKIEQKILFLFAFLVSFFTVLLSQKLSHTINIWFNFKFGSFFEQDHLLNLIILGVYAKRWSICARISLQKSGPKSDPFFSWLWRDLFIGWILSEKNMEVQA